MGIGILISFLVGFNLTINSQSISDEVVFSYQRGFYDDVFFLTIVHNSQNAVIWFTKDGTYPFTSLTAKSQTSPATLIIDPNDTTGRDNSPCVVIKACAVNNGELLTKTTTHTYIFASKIGELSPDGIKPGPGWPDPSLGTRTSQGYNYGMDPDVLNDPRYKENIEEALLSIPSISLVTDLKNLFHPDSGIYTNALNRGRDWERGVSVELLNPYKSKGFQINAGIRIRGGFGRQGSNFKHAFRLFFRAEYGEAKLNYPLFGDEGVSEFDNIDLRTTQNYSWAYNPAHGGDNARNSFLRDVFSRDTQRDMGQPYTRSRYYHLYINGTYWGVYQTQERSEASFGESYFGGSKENYDVIKVDTDNLNIPNYGIEATDGSLDAYEELWRIASSGFKSDESYYKVQGLNPDGSKNPNYPVLVDVDNLIDYMLCTIYVADPDGPVAGTIPNNFYGIYNRNSDRGFIFFRHDGEHGLIHKTLDNTLPTGTGSQFLHFNPRWLHQQLIVHPEYLLKIHNRINLHFFSGGALTIESSRKRMLARMEELNEAIIIESARWGDTYSFVPRTKDDDWLPEVNWLLDDFIPSRPDFLLPLFSKMYLYPDFEPTVFDLTSGIIEKGTTLTMSATEGTIYYTLDGNDTHLPSSLQSISQTILVPRNAEKKVHIPAASVSRTWRYDPDFDDDSWITCAGSPGGIGYDLGSDYNDIISCDIEAQMYNVNSTCLIRIPFEMTEEQLNDINQLTLRMQYNDGFILFLNKNNPIQRHNLGSSLNMYSNADTVHNEKEIVSFDLTKYLSSLHEGTNILALQGLNIAPSDSNFFISAELLGGNSLKASGPISPSAIVYDSPLTIDETSLIRARVYNEEQWSPLSEVFLRVNDEYENLTITEIHYHPIDEGLINDSQFEFIELKNIGEASLDLSGITFTQGIEYVFPAGSTIEAGSFLVLASNSSSFESRYNFTPFGEYNQQLSNGGENIELTTSTGDIVLNITYNDKYPWPNSPDGLGYSLIRKPHRLYQDLNEPNSWASSENIHGNPGAHDTVTAIEKDENSLPDDFLLFQNYPNPFNPSTTIKFSVTNHQVVTLKIYDILGREISTLLNEKKQPGNYEILFEGKDLASGIYFYRLTAGHVNIIKKMLLLK